MKKLKLILIISIAVFVVGWTGYSIIDSKYRAEEMQSIDCSYGTLPINDSVDQSNNRCEPMEGHIYTASEIRLLHGLAGLCYISFALGTVSGVILLTKLIKSRQVSKQKRSK